MSDIEPSVDSSNSLALPVQSAAPVQNASVPNPPTPPPPPPRPIGRTKVSPPPVPGGQSAAKAKPNPPSPDGAPPNTNSTRIPQPAVASGVGADGIGSAKGVRWRGELDGIRESSDQPSESNADEGESNPGPDHDGSTNEDISRKAPPWLISLLFHLLLLIILGLITSPIGDGIGKVMLTLGESSGDTVDALSEFKIEAVDAISDDNSEFNEDAPIDFDTPLDIANLVVEDSSEMIEALVGEGPKLELANPMFGGRQGATKAELLKKFGGTPETQNAVKLGLMWLKRNQSSAGSWSMRGPYRDGVRDENRIAATSMAVLAFLGDGHTHQDGDYQTEIHKALKFLTREQRRDGYFCKAVRKDDESAYAQAQATIAICEAYAMTGDSWLRPYAQAALDYAVSAQSPDGGWRYMFQEIEGDLSVTGWFVMALQSGRACKDLEIDEKVFYELERFMEGVSVSGGLAYGYMKGYGQTAAMNAEGLLVRQYTGWQRNHKMMNAGIKNLLDHYPFDMRGQRDVYYWYYGTQVMHHFGGSAWQVWNGAMREQLPAAQIKRGGERGSWAPQGDKWGDRGGGRLFQTCLSIYCLEVYYRHMPLYDAVTQQQ